MKNIANKRFIAIAVVLVMSVTSLAGCTMSDAGYIAMAMEASKLKSYTTSGEFSLEVNPSAMNPYSEEKIDPVKIKMNFLANVMQTDEEIYCEYNIKYGVNDTKMPYELNLLMVDDAIYMPVKDYVDAAMVALQFEGYSDKMCADIKSAIEKEFSQYDYVTLADFSDAMNSGMYSGMMLNTSMMVTANMQMQELLVTSLGNMFRNLDSGMTKRESNGFSIEITPDNAVALYGNVIKYLGANKKDIYKGTVKLLGDIQKIYPDSDTGAIYGMMVESLTADEQGFYDSIDEMVASYSEMNEYDIDLMKLTLKGSYLKDTITKSGNTYTDSIDMAFAYMGNKVMSMNGQVRTTPVTTINQKSVSALSPINFEDAVALTEKIERKINHATDMAISWWNRNYDYDYNYNWADISINLVEGEDWDYMEYHNEKGTMYLPMREICEWFGEDVVWDNIDKKAYVLRGDEKIEMTGMLEYKTMYVKIRDFEKLGYKVNYEYDKEYAEHIVTIKQ